jgi:hydrogenase maturation protein HypF
LTSFSSKAILMAKRVLITVRGIVQGVGYRPFIYNLAVSLGVSGFVANSNLGVVIEAQASPRRLAKFLRSVKTKHPPMAKIASVEVKRLKMRRGGDFFIEKSSVLGPKSLLVSPDLSMCPDCLKEMGSKADRRRLYPFTTCINCGPRFSIIFDTPFDRARTSMNKFKTCPDCFCEYDDPSDRRFHSEANSCALCGPKLLLYEKGRPVSNINPILKAVDLIKRGEVIALKGLGGFHLVCDASNDRAVKALREAKGRDKKPFAIMCRDVSVVKMICHINIKESSLLQSLERPIVLLEKRSGIGDRPACRTGRGSGRGGSISELVAPGNKYLGVMLPYTPLHHLLLTEGPEAIVATSANLSEEPICAERKEVEKKLAKITPFILDHDRDIITRVDDSVVKVIAKKPCFIRRARGYVPVPIAVKRVKEDILALGAELKNTFALVKSGSAFVSQHIGDLKSFGSYDHFKRTIEHFKKIFQIEPRVVAADVHPEYLSTKYAKGLKDVRVIKVQHHHAHIASCMAENGLDEKVIGVAFDGMGMGIDGTLWGAEFLIADYKAFDRFAHLKNIPLPGGDKASQEPWRMALSYLYEVFGDRALKLKGLPLLKDISENDLKIVLSMIKNGVNSPMASSMGRLFDAVSALLGLCYKNTYEGEAALELECVVKEAVKSSYDFDVLEDDGMFIIDAGKVIEGVVREIRGCKTRSAKQTGRIAAKFHNTVAQMALEICKRARESTRLNKVCLSGGCFQNKYLTEAVVELLKRAKFRVYTHSLVPANDGGISLGQAQVAANV